MILCAGFWFLNLGGLQPTLAAPPAGKNAPASSAGQATTSKPQADILALAIQDLTLKSNQVWIAIERTEKGELRLEDYLRIFVKIAGSKVTPASQWTLAQVDPGHALLRPNSRIDFNTKITLNQPEKISAAIVFGSWKETKAELLTPASLVTGAPTAATPQANLPAQVVRPAAPTPPTPVPLSGPGSGVSLHATTASSSAARPTAPGGLSFRVPGAGQRVTAGDALYFSIYFFDHAIPEGDVTISLRRVGSATEFSTRTYHYRPIEGEWSLTSNFAIPNRGLAGAEDYFLHAMHSAGNIGLSPVFNIRLRGIDGLIRILKPEARAVLNPRMMMQIGYQFTAAAGRGSVLFEMFAQDSHRPVFSFSGSFPGSAVATPQPIHFFNVQLPADLPFGNNYFIQATHAEGSGRSAAFHFTPLINHGGAEVVGDIALTDIFKDRDNKIKARVQVTGARYPMYVAWSGNHGLSVILYPGENVLFVSDGLFTGRDGACSQTFEAIVDSDNRYTETNETNNTLRKELFFLDRNGILGLMLNTSPDYVGIPYGNDQTIIVTYRLHYCGTAAFNATGLVQEVRQRGTVRTEPDFHPRVFDQAIPYEIWVTDHCDWFEFTRRLTDVGNVVQPGQCLFIRIMRSALAHQVDSEITLHLNEPAASWPGILNPKTVRIDFGAESTRPR